MRLKFNPPRITTTTAIYTWSAEHAEYVHNGALYSGSDAATDTPEIIVARPWTEEAIARSNLPAMVKRHYRGNISQAFEAAAEDLGNVFGDVIENHVWDIPPGGRKKFKDAPTWETIDDSGELKDSQSLEFG
jgi:hypothetical protein